MWTGVELSNEIALSLSPGDLIRIGDPFVGETFRVSSLLDDGLNNTISLATTQDDSVTADYPLSSVSYRPAYRIMTTTPILANAMAADVKAALETLNEVGTVDVRRDVVENGYQWTVTFTQHSGDVKLMGSNDNNLSNGLAEHDRHVWNQDASVEIVSVGTYVIEDLPSGTEIAATVSAFNNLGYGSAVSSNPTTLVARDVEPEAPTQLSVMSASSTEMLVQWEAPSRNGGSPVTYYKVEWDTNEDFNTASDGSALGWSYVVSEPSETEARQEIQAVTTSASTNDLGGTFRVKFNGQSTPELPFDVLCE